MRLPPYGRALFNARMAGERPRVVQLLVGEFWKSPKWMPPEIPRLAVKTARWDDEAAERFEWRVVADMTVFAIDVRLPDERVETRDGWDPWLWLLADVQRYARDVLMFTPMIEFATPKDMFAPERALDCYAWCARDWDLATRKWKWPRWWPYGERFVEAAA